MIKIKADYTKKILKLRQGLQTVGLKKREEYSLWSKE